jgi:hypothetical protein
MKNSQSLRRVLLISSLPVLSVVIAAGVYTQTSKSQKKQNDHSHTYEAAKVKSAPEVRSAIRDLEISGVRLINEGTPQAAVVINVTNNRDKAVMALDFVAGKDDYSALGFDGLLLEDGPIVIIPPHTLKTFTWFLGEIREGETIVLASAIFADGKEEGDKRSLDGMKIHRRHFQQNQRDAKVKDGGQ